MALTPFRIPALQQRNPIVDDQGRMTPEFARRLQDAFDAIPKMIRDTIIAQNAADMAQLTGDNAQTSADAAQLAADTAQAAADAAQSAADANAKEQSLVSSGILPRTVVTASSAGVVSIATHTRYYGDGTSVAVNAGSIPGNAVGAQVFVSYLDADHVGGAVVYLASATFQPQTATRHVVGSVTIPATGTATGEPGPAPPGGAA